MNEMTMKTIKVSLAAAVVVASLTGCGFINTTPTPQPAQLRLTAPVSGTTLAANEIISIQGEYSGDAIAQVQLLVNGVSDSALEVRAGDPTLAMDWLPKATGRLILYLEGYDQNQSVVARSDAVVVMVDASATAAATVAASPTADAAALAPTAVISDSLAVTDTAALTSSLAPTATNELTATAAATTTVGAEAMTSSVESTLTPTTAASTASASVTTSSTPVLTVTTDVLNLRSGPGTNYDAQGQLSQGQTATIVGKNADGTWWQVRVDGNKAWVVGEFVQVSAAAASVPVVQVSPAPTAAATAESPTPAATPQVVAVDAANGVPPSTPAAAATTDPVQIIEFVTSVPSATVAPAATEGPTPTPEPAAQACGPSNPSWAAALNNNPQYEFCTPVPFEFVPNASADPDELVIRWHIFGIKSLELRIDPSGDGCGIGSTGRRQQVALEEYNFRLNRRDFPPGGYKVGLWATLDNGRVQDWGELHFCGKG